MSVDYSGVGGVGIEITHEIKNKLIVANEGETYDGCLESMLGDLELDLKEAGDGNYTGDDNTFYISLEGDNLKELIENSAALLEKLEGFGIKLTLEDIEVIEDLHVW